MLCVAFAISVALLSSSALSEDEKKSENVPAPEKTRIPRRKHSDNDTDTFGQIGRSLAAVFKEFSNIFVTFMKEVREATDNVQDEKVHSKYSSSAKESRLSNFINGVVSFIKSTFLRTSRKPVISERTLKIEERTQTVRELSTYVTTHSPDLTSNSVLLKDHSDLQTSTDVDPFTEIITERSLIIHDTNTCKTSLDNQINPSEKVQTWNHSMYNYGGKERGYVRKSFRLKHVRNERNDYISLYDEYDTQDHKDLIKMMQKNHLSKSNEYKMKDKLQSKFKSGRRLLAGRPYNRDAFEDNIIKQKNENKRISRINFKELLNAVQAQTSNKNKDDWGQTHNNTIKQDFPDKTSNYFSSYSNNELKCNRYTEQTNFELAKEERKFASIASGIGKARLLKPELIVLTPKPDEKSQRESGSRRRRRRPLYARRSEFGKSFG